MKKFTVTKNDEGQTLLKYSAKILAKAPMSVIRKALRKKNIDLNGKKADGSESLKAGDEIQIWFSDETFAKFMSVADKHKSSAKDNKKISEKELKSFEKSILYEDENVVIINKAAGILTQSDDSNENSLNDILLAYCSDFSKIRTFKPSICNRLDRNTSGIVIAGKTIKGLQKMNELIKDRSVRKFYRTILFGEFREEADLKAWLRKEKAKNKVFIYDSEKENSVEIETIVNPIEIFKSQGYSFTYAEVDLVTGRPHQIRAHLSHVGCPVMGDSKYGSSESIKCSEKFGIRRQMLHAARLEFPKLKGEFAALSEKIIEAPIAQDMNSLLKLR
ncbi:MAG: RluA family pseudouridine synthase [Lachnospiraceae bacterium]|nr:RluA family pseudouridine synthase [Lachnospiraceae bacterium]